MNAEGKRSGRAASYQPDRGDLIYLDFAPQAGREQSGRRPALVLSPKEYNVKTGLAVVCPITRRVKGFPFEVPLPPGAKLEGVVLSDHLKNLDWVARHAHFHATLDQATINDVLARIESLLQIGLGS